jgi:hypothetical protein
MNTKKLAYWASVSAVGLVVGISLQMVHANWTPPPGAAPAGNISAPLNTGSAIQTKNGPMKIDQGLVLNQGLVAGAVANGLLVANGSVGIGTTTPGQKLDVSGQIHASDDICTSKGGTTKCLSSIAAGSPFSSCTTVTSAVVSGLSTTATCAAGYTMTGGGCNAQGGTNSLSKVISIPAGNGWTCGQSSAAGTATAYARCCK